MQMLAPQNFSRAREGLIPIHFVIDMGHAGNRKQHLMQIASSADSLFSPLTKVAEYSRQLALGLVKRSDTDVDFFTVPFGGANRCGVRFSRCWLV